MGSFLIALIWDLSLKAGMFSDNMRLALTTGFMGGLTTYSSFNYETTAMANKGEVGRALLYVGLTLIGCTVAGLLGLWLARRIS